MNAGDADRARLGMQTVVERRADCQDAATNAFARLEDDDLASRLSQNISRTQAGESCADYDDWTSCVRGARLRASSQQRWRGGSRQRGELEKPSTSDVSAHVERAAKRSF